ncbi:MAG: CHAT domain-containing protein, partial [Cyanobacteria bacterium P01_H01_bin.121]
WIALAPDAAGVTTSADVPGILQAREIAQMNLLADLVVLSACETGQGKLTGDGVIGLSRSFLTAGAPSVIVSLWTVPDEATANLMIDFYEHLSTSPDKAQALRQAMLNAIAAGQPPLDWAAFTLIGEAL